MDYIDLPLTDSRDGTDGEILCFALERVHKEFAWKTGGLSAEQLRRQQPPSTLTLAWLIKHLADVEDGFTAAAQGRTAHTLPDAEEPEDLYALWYGVVERCRAAWAEMIADGGLDVIVPWGDDTYTVSRRRILVDLLEENLIHLGHVDLLREAIDGRRGHGWPEAEQRE